MTHNLARPKIAEINSVANQIKFAIEAGFKGVLHICHISCSEAVELVVAARAQGEIRITCAVTPHHIMWAEDMLKRLDGWLYRVNPPLRSIQDVLRLRQQLKEGKIDWVESDHAPHAIGEKLLSPHLSGFPSLHYYRYFVETFLPNIGLSAEQIEALTSGNISKVFDGTKRRITTLKTRFRRDDMAKAVIKTANVAKGTFVSGMANLFFSTIYDPLGLVETGANDVMYIIARDMDTEGTDVIIRTCIPVDIEKGGECTVRAKEFTSVITNLPRKTTLKLEAGFLLRRDEVEIKTDSARFKFYATRPGPENFPLISQKIRLLVKNGLSFVSVDAKTLATMLQKTSFAASHSREASPPTLNGVNLYLAPKGKSCLFTMAATDGHRIAVAKTAAEGAVKAEEVTIPLQAAKIILKAFKKGVVRMGFAGEWIIFDAGETAIVIRPIKEGYPHYEEVLQATEKTTKKTILTVDKERLLAVLRRAKTMVRNNFPIIGINAKGGVLKVSSSSPKVGEALEEMPIIKQDGDDVEISINLHHLVEALRSIEGKGAVIEMNDSNAPVVVRPAESSSCVEYFSVIMPVPL